MKNEAKEKAVDALALGLTIGTGVATGWLFGLGSVTLINHTFQMGLTRPQMMLATGVVASASGGVCLLTMRKVAPMYRESLREIFDILDTTNERPMKEVNNAE